jgi:hypothetical protein
MVPPRGIIVAKIKKRAHRTFPVGLAVGSTGGAFLAALIAGSLLSALPASAQALPELRLCPPSVRNVCYIGYVTSATKIVVLLSSMDNDPLVGEEVEVDSSSAGASGVALDLTLQMARVVMLDGTGDDHIHSARLVSVADPLLTALYMSSFLQPADGATPQ